MAWNGLEWPNLAHELASSGLYWPGIKPGSWICLEWPSLAHRVAWSGLYWPSLAHGVAWSGLKGLDRPHVWLWKWPKIALQHIVPECSSVIGHFHETFGNIKHLCLIEWKYISGYIYWPAHTNIKTGLIFKLTKCTNLEQRYSTFFNDWKKSGIWETLNLSTDADRSTDTIFFFWRYNFFLEEV